MQDTQTGSGKEDEKGGEQNFYLPFFLHSFDVVHIFHSGVSPNYEKMMVKKTTNKKEPPQIKQRKCPALCLLLKLKHLSLFFPVLIVHLTRNLNLPPHQVSRWFFICLQFLI